jgi:mercuric ion binding protein
MESIPLLLAAVLTSASVLAAGSRMITLDVTNMDCALCPITVRKALEKVPGVETAEVDFKTKSAVVAFDPAKTSPDALAQATADAGFPSSVKPVQ